MTMIATSTTTNSNTTTKAKPSVDGLDTPTAPKRIGRPPKVDGQPKPSDLTLYALRKKLLSHAFTYMETVSVEQRSASGLKSCMEIIQAFAEDHEKDEQARGKGESKPPQVHRSGLEMPFDEHGNPRAAYDSLPQAPLDPLQSCKPTAAQVSASSVLDGKAPHTYYRS
jgi:hypothetical protein